MKVAHLFVITEVLFGPLIEYHLHATGKGTSYMVPQKETPKVYPVSAVTRAIAEETGLPQAQVKKTLEAFFAFTKKVVGEGDKVRVLDFGTFENRHRNEQSGHNPRTGEIITVPALDRLSFRGTYKYE